MEWEWRMGQTSAQLATARGVVDRACVAEMAAAAVAALSPAGFRFISASLFTSSCWPGSSRCSQWCRRSGSRKGPA